MFDPSFFECELISEAVDAQPVSQPSSKRFRQPDNIDLRSPANYRKPKKQDAQNDNSRQNFSNSRSKGYKLLTNKLPKKDFLIKSLFVFSRFWKKCWAFAGTQF